MVGKQLPVLVRNTVRGLVEGSEVTRRSTSVAGSDLHIVCLWHSYTDTRIFPDTGASWFVADSMVSILDTLVSGARTSPKRATPSVCSTSRSCSITERAYCTRLVEDTIERGIADVGSTSPTNPSAGVFTTP